MDATVETHQIPPDVITGDAFVGQEHWYSRLALPTPIAYTMNGIIILAFGTASLVIGLQSDGLRKPKPFWQIFPVFLASIFSLGVMMWVQFSLLPAFWNARARAMIDEGYFNSSTKQNGGRKLVLEVGCNEGYVSAAFARAIIDRQREVSNSKAPHASLPIFIGYDKWNPWTRIPNTPAHFLSTMLAAGVPRNCIVANRMDLTSTETKTSLPYPSGSISLILCNIGLTECLTDRDERTILCQELVRVLEPGGRMVIVESEAVGEWTAKELWSGTAETYKRFLRDKMGMGQENVADRWDRAVHYIVATKPPGTAEAV
jgi:SAM-dependent methyltransferase